MLEGLLHLVHRAMLIRTAQQDLVLVLTVLQEKLYLLELELKKATVVGVSAFLISYFQINVSLQSGSQQSVIIYIIYVNGRQVH